MTIRVALQHNTYYKFDRHVNLSAHVIRLRPAPHSRTPIHAYSLKVKPETHFINWQQDAFGNYLARLVFPEKTNELSVEVEVIADMTVINPFDFFLEEYAENYPFSYDKQSKKELKPYLEKIKAGPLLTQWLAEISDKKMRTIDFLVALNSHLQQEISYSIRMEPGVQTPEETLERKIGSCRDTAWLLVQILRHKGLAARFASGYLVQLKQDEKSLDGPSGAEEDFTDLHAWCEVYLPGAGWVGLDPTSGLFASEGHIPLACTPDPVSAAPITGATDKCEVEFSHSNDVFRIHEDPRVTKPYTEEQWQQVLALGNFVDKEYQENDVCLTMGGEPTFVSIDDMESAQWNTEALGAHKLSLAKGLLLKLRDHFAPHGLLHYGQGKWYPGEEVPRWALGLYWRSDGEALWKNQAFLARVDKDYGFDFKSAHKFSRKLVKLLNIEEDYVQPCYEDALHYLLEEQKVPVNIELLAAKVKDDLGRKRLARLLEKGLDKPSGFVIPLSMVSFPNHWRSSKWETRRGRLVLIPGDSPMGLRLPLGSLPWSEEYESFEKYLEPVQDPFTPRSPLQKRDNIVFQTGAEDTRDLHDDDGHENSVRKSATKFEEKKQKVTGVRDVLRTALCVEAREGKLYLFMPPLPNLEQYVALIAAIEECASSLKMPVVIEGYEPPRDYRITKLLVTPDPGVIEVNIHPANNWQELVNTTNELYRVARESRLGTEKFMLDGRHTGTGGGNHITLGGKTPADSPILRRPDLLRSLVTYWQHHPCLSYLFSGAFIGPTSQAPRADEGRDEMLYELEVAFKQMPEGLNEQPWLIDRIMRNLLIDITGNTHRAEFCIDKLYAPGSPSGRLGLLEFRGFEMPPHSRMALVQALLLRSLVARFWKAPYKKPLVRWGTSLHDKFMLPHYIWEDMRSVVADLQEHGYQFELEWMLPFLEFRFPHYGRTRIDNVELELHWAIEPWHVLGEEIGSFGTARYVDSSVERVQVKAKGLIGERHVLVCNGRRVPLSATSVKGEYVAGVRYKAWAPPSALHPTIGVHTPLVFDLIDTWNGMAVGGFTYHVSHPGGRSYDTYPVNAFEAESRRISRYEGQGFTQGPFTPRPEVDALREFFPQGYAPRPMAPPEEVANDEFPHTLDLRRAAD